MDNIVLEVGNELWNPGFRPQGFQNGEYAGAFINRIFSYITQNSPYLNDSASPNYVGDKIELHVAGWYPQNFTKQVFTNAPEAESWSVAGYIGGWEAGIEDVHGEALNDIGFFSTTTGAVSPRDTELGVVMMREDAALGSDTLVGIAVWSGDSAVMLRPR